MTTSDPKKQFKQLEAKPVKMKKFLKHNMPKKRTTGRASKKCTRCSNTRAFIGKYKLNLCRRCFREVALDLGFKKFN